MSDRNGIPTFVHLALTSASTEVRRVAQLTAELPDHDRRIKELREAYAQEKADAEKALSARAAEVDAAVKEREGIVGALGEAQENAQGGQDMVRLWCQANNRPVPEMPDLRDLTMPFQSVAPASGPVQSVPDRSAEGVAPRDMQQGVTYLDRNGYAWKVTGEQVREDGVMPMLTGSSGSGLALPADQVINAAGPLRVAPNVVDFAELVPGPLCKNCRKPVAIDRQGDWFHIDEATGGTYSCYPDAAISTDAEPVPAQPAPVSPDAQPVTDLPAQTEGGA